MVMTSKDKDTDDSYTEVLTLYRESKNARSTQESDWNILGRLYTGFTVNSNNSSWQTNISSGKAYELVETLVAYLTRTFFFATKWFDLVPSASGVDGYKPVAITLLADMIADSNFYQVISECFRQFPVTGLSGITVKLCNGKLVFGSISAYNLYLTKDDKAFFHREVYTEEQLEEAWKYLALKSTTVKDFDELLSFTRAGTNDTSNNQGFLNNQLSSATGEAVYELVSYYCYDYDTGYYERTVLANTIVVAHIEKVSPRMVPTVLSINKIPDTIYGVPPLAPSVGLIAEQEALKNYRLSNAKLGSYMMFIASDEDTLPDMLAFAPGKVFKARDVGNLQPLQIPDATNGMTSQEAEMLNQDIYKNIGLGAGTSANVARQGERVTAAEITSLKEASGIRLNQLFMIVESGFVTPLLNNILETIKKAKGKRVVSVKQKDDSYNLFNVTYEILQGFNVSLSVNGVRERLENVQKLVDLLNLTGQNEAVAAVVDIAAVVKDIVMLYGFDNPDKYIKQEAPVAPPEAPIAPQQPMPGGIGNPEDNGVIQAMLRQAQTDPSVQALKFTDTPNDPEVQSGLAQQQMEQQMMQQQGTIV